jgi:hypothetical protein
MTLPIRALAAASLAIPGSAHADQTARLINAPATAQAPAVKLAVQYQLKLHLPEGRGLARLLLDAGVDREDAAAAARLAAGHLGDGHGGCEAQISVSRAPDGEGFRLVRAMLTTGVEQTIIERRGSDLTVAAERPTRKTPVVV